MLWTPGNHFNWSVDNHGVTFTAAALGTQITAGGSNNTKGSTTQLLAAIAEDCYGIAIRFASGFSNAAIRNFLADLMIDPAGGTNWTVAIANLLNPGANLGVGGGVQYYFPLYLKAGTSIGMRAQCSTASSTFRVGIKLFGKPTRPELVRVGSKVQTLGADTANSRGTAVTPGASNVKGSYSASLGTLSFDAWWWQAGFAYADTALAAGVVMQDVAVNSTNKLLVAENITTGWDGAENWGKDAFGDKVPAFDVPTGQDVYTRVASTATTETTPTGIVYALGG